MKNTLAQGDIPKLPGWLTVPEAAERLGVTPNRVNQLVHKNRFVAGEDLFRVGSAALVIREEAVKRFERARPGAIRTEMAKTRWGKVVSTITDKIRRGGAL